ncbi:MAG: hypothetical protein ABR521_10310 [Gaiellaceae bacterium]
MAHRSPHLHKALRGFCLGGFRLLSEEVEGGSEIPFAFEEHAARGRPSLYEYRPLVRDYVEARAQQLAQLSDARIALEELKREPAAAIFARAHAEAGLSEDEGFSRSILLPLLESAAEACGGFDWDDRSFDRAYRELERSLFGERRAYAAVAALIGLSAGRTLELGAGLRVRLAAAGELAAHWPQATNLLPQDFGREPDRLCVLELERALEADAHDPPDAPGELADAVTAIRLATAGPIAAGPVIFERLDWRPLGVRPVLPIAAGQPGGEPIRLDAVRGALARDLLEQLALADEDPELGEALDRWELSLFQSEPFRSEQLREAIGALLGSTDGLWAAALRTSVLLGETGRERAAHLAELRQLAAGDAATPAAAEAIRRAVVETLAHGDRAALIEALDETLLGVRTRPAGYVARALAS